MIWKDKASYLHWWTVTQFQEFVVLFIFSAKTATHMAVMSPKATCNQPRGFLAVIDSPTTCYWTWTPRLGRFPHFLYSFDPTGKVGLLSNAQERREADTLEIRVIPYVTFYRATGMMGHFARWDFEHQYLVFSVTAGSSLDPAAMWKGNLISPPQFFTVSLCTSRFTTGCCDVACTGKCLWMRLSEAL